MIGEKLRFNRAGLVVVDLLATYLALFVAFHLRFTFEIVPVTKGVPPWGPYLALYPIITLIWPVVFYFRRLLDGRPQRLVRLRLEHVGQPLVVHEEHLGADLLAGADAGAAGVVDAHSQLACHGASVPRGRCGRPRPAASLHHRPTNQCFPA